MIKRLRYKFVALAAVSLFVLLAFIILGINFLNYKGVVSETDYFLSILSEDRKDGADSRPDVPHEGHQEKPQKDDGHEDGKKPKLPFESRYFSAALSLEGEILSVNTESIKDDDLEKTEELISTAYSSEKKRGFSEKYRFLRTEDEDGIRITFIDMRRDFHSVYNFLWTSLSMAVTGYILVIFVIIFFSGKYIAPIAKSYEKQKRFITDAGHELKTPLTIISANADILEMEYGKGECIDDIREQSYRLSALTNDLIYLAKMEETGEDMSFYDISLSQLVTTVAPTFRAVAIRHDVEYICRIAEGLQIKGDGARLEQLLNVLLDNAMKYAPSGGVVALTLEKQGRFASLSVRNTIASPVSKETLASVFDRFYRADPSRNSERGGQGIGLSIAYAIAVAHGGRIRADAPREDEFSITVSLPLS